MQKILFFGRFELFRKLHLKKLVCIGVAPIATILPINAQNQQCSVEITQEQNTLAQAEKQLQQSEQQLLQGVGKAERPAVQQAFKDWRAGVRNLLEIKARELEAAKAEPFVRQMQAKIFQQRSTALQEIANNQASNIQDEQQINKTRIALKQQIEQILNNERKQMFSDAASQLIAANMQVFAAKFATNSGNPEIQQQMLHCAALMAQSELLTLQSLWPQLANTSQQRLTEQQGLSTGQIAQARKQPSINDYKDEIARLAEQSRKELLAAEQGLLQKHPAAETAACLQQCFAEFAKFSQTLLDIEQTRLEGSLAIYSLMDFKAQLNRKRTALLLALADQAELPQPADLEQTNKQMQVLCLGLAKQLPAAQYKRLNTAMQQLQRSDLSLLETLYAKVPAGQQRDALKSRDLAMLAAARKQMLELMVSGEQ